MIFNNTFSIGDIIDLLSIMLVVVGGFFALYQWKNTSKIKRADYIKELTEKIRIDSDIKNIVYVLDYEQGWYTQSFHNGGEIEIKMDKTLFYFSYICYLYQYKVITKKEFEFFKYDVNRILMNEQIKNYFYNIYHFADKVKAPVPFKYLFEYGEKKKVFDKEFYNRKSTQYVHYLNF